jgi:hypothetical protein
MASAGAAVHALEIAGQRDLPDDMNGNVALEILIGEIAWGRFHLAGLR